MIEEFYATKDEAILDMMANTDTSFVIASRFADLIFEHGWTYDNGPDSRSLRLIGPAGDKTVIEINIGTKNGFGYDVC